MTPREMNRSLPYWAQKAMLAVLSMLFVLVPSYGHAQSSQLTPPKMITMSPTGVNLNNGTFTINSVDLSIEDLKLERTYLGRMMTRYGSFGNSWVSNFDIYFTYACPGPCKGSLVTGASVKRFTGSPSTAWTPDTDSTGTSLANTSSGPIFTDKDGTIYTFGGAIGGYNRVSSISYPNGRQRNFYYDSGAHLKFLKDSMGIGIIFDYDSQGRAIDACGVNLSKGFYNEFSGCAGEATRADYTYTSDSAHLLNKYTDYNGNYTNYSYDINSYLTCWSVVNSTSCRINNTYWADGAHEFFQIRQQQLADGSVWNFDEAGSYDPMSTDPPGYNNVFATDPLGKRTEYDFYAFSPMDVIDPLNRITTIRNYGYGFSDPATFPSYVTTPEGVKISYGYDNRYNETTQTWSAKSGSGLADIVSVTKTYPTTCVNVATCNLPLSAVDAMGGETDWAYVSWGGVASEMQPAPAAGGARPLKLYTYVQKSAYVMNSGGALVSTGAPIWVISTMTQCQTVAWSGTAACDTAASAPQLQTTYQYGADGTANNLLVRGTEVKDLVTGDKQLTCFTYDPIGRRVSETKPRGTASLSVCP